MMIMVMIIMIVTTIITEQPEIAETLKVEFGEEGPISGDYADERDVPKSGLVKLQGALKSTSDKLSYF